MNRVQWIWGGLLLALLASWPELAVRAAPKLLSQDLVARTWAKEEGLPDNSVTAVLQTRDSYLWVGTLGGLARFDGVRFMLVAPTTGKTNEPLRVTALCEDSAGRLWIGTQGEGLLWHANGVVSRFERNASLSDQTINSIAEDTAGRLWVGTPLGLSCLEGSRVTRFGAGDGLPNDFVSSVHVARSGTVWITTSAGMCQYRDGQLLAFPFQPDSASRNPLYLGVYEDHQGNQWAFGDTYLVKIDKLRGEGKRLNYFRSGDTSSVRLWSLCEGRNGQLWIGTSGQGLYCFGDDKLVKVTLRSGPLSSDVRALIEDNEGNLWLGTYGGGLVRLQPRSARLLDMSVGLPNLPAVCLALGAEGRLWVGFEHGGLYAGGAERFEPGTREGGLDLQNLISSLCVAPDSSLWVGTPGTGLYCLNGDHVFHYTTANGLSDNAILSLAAEPDGAVWVGTMSGGLHRFSKGLLTSFGNETGLPGQPLSAILPANRGGIWLGTTTGELLRGDGEHFQRVDPEGVLAGKAVRAMYEDPRGRLWLGTASGRLACLAGGRSRAWDANPGSQEDAVTGIAGNNSGELYFASGKGIYHVTETEAEAWLAGQSSLHPELFFETESPANASSACGWPRALSWPDGRFWFASASGVITFDPHGLEPGTATPAVRLEGILVNGQPLPPSAWSGQVVRDKVRTGRGISTVRGLAAKAVPGWNSGVRLPSDLRSLEIQFTGFCFAAPEKVRFRHRLEGFDADWVDSGAERRVRYGRLPYGNYKFHVTACNAADCWNEQSAEFAFLIPTPAWRTGWALALYGFAGVGLIAGSARLVSYRRLRRHLAHLAQEQAMQRERMRIAQDMHDEIGSKLTRISFMSERAKCELQGQQAVATKLDTIAHTSRDLLQSLDEIVWAVSPQNDSLEHLAAYLGHYASEYLQNTAIDCELHIPQILPDQPLSAETRHNVFLAFEEALNNALKHGKPSRIRIAMAAEASRFEIAVEDNGRGFDDSTAAERPVSAAGAAPHKRVGHGLWNMRQRLADVGGQCAISSQPGKGARVVLSIPFATENL